jgi:hypothetical protein
MAKNKRSYSSLTNNSDTEENKEFNDNLNNIQTQRQNCDLEFKKREKNEDKKYYLVNYLFKTMKISISIYGIYILWIFLHYVSAHLYTNYCVPNTIYGIIISPILTTTPHCQGLRWIIYNGGNQINNMWITLGSWLCLKILY